VKSNGDKTSPCFRPFLMENMLDSSHLLFIQLNAQLYCSRKCYNLH